MGVDKAKLINKLLLLGYDYIDMGWAIVTKKDSLYGFIDLLTSTIENPKYTRYDLNDWFFYGVLKNMDASKSYDRGHLYIRGIKNRQFARTIYLDVKFGDGDFRVASVGTTTLRGKDYLINNLGEKIILAKNRPIYGANRISINKPGVYEVYGFGLFDEHLNYFG